jgi:predicted RNA binding protein YcfA (HicA-like mRNA interferase family)
VLPSRHACDQGSQWPLPKTARGPEGVVAQTRRASAGSRLMKPRELLARCARGDFANVAFRDLQRLLEALGFVLDHQRGDHHLYRHATVHQRVNIQPHGAQSKPYQVRQVLELVERYGLELKEHE